MSISTSNPCPAPSPLPIEPTDRDLILVGGTFDPPHRAHTHLPALARQALGLSDAVLVYIPAAASPFKAGSPASTSAADRLAMLRLAIADLPRAVIWTDEIDRGGGDAPSPSYWIDTLRRLRSMSAMKDATAGGGVTGTKTLRFVIGSDQAVEFHRWREFRETLRLASAIVLPRAPVAGPEEFAAALRRVGEWSEPEVQGWVSSLAPVPTLNVSSTQIRERLKKGEGGVDGLLAAELDPRVLGYIRASGLYTP